MAETVYDDMYKVFGKTSCSQNSGGVGGIWWDRMQTYVNAIPNGLFLSLAAHLATRVEGDRKDGYVDTAKKQWNWFKNTAMFNDRGTINDGLINGCQSNEEYQETVWSYNQGVAVGGLAELATATGDPSYITSARGIADAAIAELAPNGILVDICEHNSSCNGDQTQFKGVFVRNLIKLQKASPQPLAKYADFLHSNANSIWSKNRNEAGQLSLQWGGPFMNPANASTHSSALDCLVASLST